MNFEDFILEGNKSGDSSLHDWFNKSKASDGTKGWVQLGGKYAGKPCARQPGQTTKPKCGSSKMKRDLNKKEEDAAFRRKNREDGNPDKKGKAKNVATEGVTYETFVEGRAQVARGLVNQARGVAGDSNDFAGKINTGSDIGRAARQALFKAGNSKLAAIGRATSGLGTALGAGAAIGQAYKNTNRAPAVSGRGAGRATFNNNSTPGAKLDP